MDNRPGKNDIAYDMAAALDALSTELEVPMRIHGSEELELHPDGKVFLKKGGKATHVIASSECKDIIVHSRPDYDLSHEEGGNIWRWIQNLVRTGEAPGLIPWMDAKPGENGTVVLTQVTSPLGDEDIVQRWKTDYEDAMAKRGLVPANSSSPAAPAAGRGRGTQP